MRAPGLVPSLAGQPHHWMRIHQINRFRRLGHNIHIGMATSKPDFFNINHISSGTSCVVVVIHLQKVFRHEVDSTFIESERMSEMARVCY